ncbi:unnamed protein product [Zymoseptoria tritici ST99CH_1A5]|nr:unnamed protein product [Zymoseptoria tritici ST99CH_1E4]SMR54839.1 unnamed protein product [Zymoseptoria tritici ST99CH_3D1]SMY24907.1 unnamed protein product [Zymoseptoria tritici ST99CH_1A5]
MADDQHQVEVQYYDNAENEKTPHSDAIDVNINIAELINASGHVQELDRSFGFWSIVSLSWIANNAWAAGSGALVIALYNGGGPGVLYGLVAASFFYLFIIAGLSELASAIPSSANVYRWSAVTAGRYGRVCSWYAGRWSLDIRIHVDLFVLPGPFYMRGVKGDAIITVACAYILVFNALYMFPSTYPVASPEGMNWASVMFVGITACLTGWSWWKRKRGYVGPRVELQGNDAVNVGRIGLDVQVKGRRTEGL